MLTVVLIYYTAVYYRAAYYYCYCLTTDNQLEHQVSSMGHRTGHMHSTAAPQEPNLNDVVDFLSNPDPTLIANAASYLQHLAYNDDQMKAKIRQYGAIPSLVNQLRHPDFRVQLAVLGALRNMSYGRTNNDSKVEIADDPGLGELTILLKITSHAEVSSSTLPPLSRSPSLSSHSLAHSLSFSLTLFLSLSLSFPPSLPLMIMLSLPYRYESWSLRYYGISQAVM